MSCPTCRKRFYGERKSQSSYRSIFAFHSPRYFFLSTALYVPFHRCSTILIRKHVQESRSGFLDVPFSIEGSYASRKIGAATYGLGRS